MRKFPRSHWIKRPSLWCCIGALLVCFLPLSQWTVVAYTPSILANATIVFYIIIPAMAVAVAWEASRFRPVIGVAANSVRKFFWIDCFGLLYSLRLLTQRRLFFLQEI